MQSNSCVVMFHPLSWRSVIAGQNLSILMEEVMPGWSLVRRQPSTNEPAVMGLVPTSIYTFTADLELSPQVIANTPPNHPKSLPSLSIKSEHVTSPRKLPPIIPQPTGAPPSPLRAYSLNRFSAFVTSGAEDWILNGGMDSPTTPKHARLASDQSDVQVDLSRGQTFAVEVQDSLYNS